MEPQAAEQDSLGTVLVVGGCGFLGYHIIQALRRDSSCGAIYALARSSTSNLQDGVEYRAGDITNAATLHTLLEEIKPQVIIHAASPRSSAAILNSKEQLNTNIIGTQNLLASAVKISSVRAFVFTSTVSVATGSPHVNVDETQPTCQLNSKDGTIYYQTKAVAERLVLEANSEKLKTVSLRLCLVYGERDNQFVPGLLTAVSNKQTGVQLGNNKNLIDTVYAGNAALAHVLAAKALLNPRYAPGKVDGEAFNITDGNPVPFWDLSRLVWHAAGDKSSPKDAFVIPAWVAMAMAGVAESVFWLGTLGRKRPLMLNRLVITHCVRNYTYNIEKARRSLGFNPVPNLEDGIKSSVEWELQKRESEKQQTDKKRSEKP